MSLLGCWKPNKTCAYCGRRGGDGWVDNKGRRQTLLDWVTPWPIIRILKYCSRECWLADKGKR